MAVSIKINEENYEMLCEISGKLRSERKRPVSINEAISSLISKGKLSELAGSWSMSDEEASDASKSLKKGWSKWKIKSV